MRCLTASPLAGSSFRSADFRTRRESLIERLNVTFRSRLALLGRRTRCSARNRATVARGMSLVGTVSNFCTTHDRLPKVDGRRQTPAMAAGITDHACMSGRSVSYATTVYRPRAGSHLAVAGVAPRLFRPSLSDGALTTIKQTPTPPPNPRRKVTLTQPSRPHVPASALPNHQQH